MNSRYAQQRQPQSYTRTRAWLAAQGGWLWRLLPKPPDKYQTFDNREVMTITKKDNIKRDSQRSSIMTKQIFKKSGPLLGIIAAALIWVASAATPADALVAAGTTISNQATVSYLEGADANSNIVNTTVNLVSGLAWDDTSLSPTTQSVGSNIAVSNYTADLLNLGNGTTVVTISDGTTQNVPANLTAGAWVISPNNPTLIGTVSSAAATDNGTNTTIPVSNLNNATIVNGTTQVHIGGATGTYYTVFSSSQTELVVVGVVAVPTGTQIGEVITVTFNGDAGALQNSSLSELHLHAMTATDDIGGGVNSDGNPAATDTISSDGTNLWQTSVIAGALAITKYVRNVTTGNAGTGAAFAYDGFNYYLTGVTGNSTTDTLEYLIVISNAGPGDATDVTVTDDINPFLTLTTTSVDIDTNGDGIFDRVDAVNNDGASITGTVLTVYAGVGGTAAGTTGGAIVFDATPTSAVRFQAAIQ
ncbi:MAG: hypothetical protein IBX47_04970 [Desulfuromonadales bacterium]|nr:hypothetical protein [Desulfuromonadales bacterium]